MKTNIMFLNINYENFEEDCQTHKVLHFHFHLEARRKDLLRMMWDPRTCEEEQCKKV